MANDHPSVRFAVRACTSTETAADGWGFPVSKCNSAVENEGSLNKNQSNVSGWGTKSGGSLRRVTPYRDQQLQRLVDIKIIEA